MAKALLFLLISTFFIKQSKTESLALITFEQESIRSATWSDERLLLYGLGSVEELFVQIHEELEKNNNLQLYLTGHICDLESIDWAYQRMDFVKEYLIYKGIDSGKIVLNEELPTIYRVFFDSNEELRKSVDNDLVNISRRLSRSVSCQYISIED